MLIIFHRLFQYLPKYIIIIHGIILNTTYSQGIIIHLMSGFHMC